MKRSKSGISLIVLVITIIVMIVLAAAVIVSLSNSGIINKANTAVKDSNEAEANHLASLVWAEAYIDNKDIADPDERQAAIETAVLTELEKQGITDTDYNIEVTDKGVSVTLKDVTTSWVREYTDENVPIPVGFVASPYDGTDGLPAENKKDGGLVIYALTPDEIEKNKTNILEIDKEGLTDAKEIHYKSMTTRNQFVWVPVDKDNFEDDFVRTAFMGEDFSENVGETYDETEVYYPYWELALDEYNMPLDNTKNITSYVSKATLAEATAMYASVKKYGGFYIARYEAGADSYETVPYGEESTIKPKGNISVTMGKYPYNYIAWGNGMTEQADDGGAVSLARSFYPSDETTYGVVSTLTYGVQWDSTLAWWKEMNTNFDLTQSKNYGVYDETIISSDPYNDSAKYLFYDIYENVYWGPWKDLVENEDYTGESIVDTLGSCIMTTGGYKKANVYNIYDMAGNLDEWTMEGYCTHSRARRGGSFNGSDPVAIRRSSSPSYTNNYSGGFRPALYIK